MYSDGWWIWYLISITVAACWAEIFISVLTTLKTQLTKHILIVPGALAIISTLVHSNTLRQYKCTVRYTPAWKIAQIVYSLPLAIITFILGIAWFVITVVLFVFASTLPRRPRPGVKGDDLLYKQPPYLFWVFAIVAYLTSGLHFVQFGLGLYYRRRFLKTLRTNSVALPPQNHKLLTEPHSKWMLNVVLAGLVVGYTAFGISLGDGAYGGYSIWLILASSVLTVALHSATIIAWRKTAKQRWGGDIPPFIYSVTLAILLFLLAAFWSATTAISFLIAAGKFGTKYFDYIEWSFRYRRYRVFYYVRWSAAGLALLLALLTWTEFVLVVIYRSRFFKKLSNAKALSGTQVVHGEIAMNTANNANTTDNNNNNNDAAGSNSQTPNEKTSSAVNIYPELLGTKGRESSYGGAAFVPYTPQQSPPLPLPVYNPINPVNNAIVTTPDNPSYQQPALYSEGMLYPQQQQQQLQPSYHPTYQPPSQPPQSPQTYSVYNPTYQPPTSPPPK